MPIATTSGALHVTTFAFDDPIANGYYLQTTGNFRFNDIAISSANVSNAFIAITNVDTANGTAAYAVLSNISSNTPSITTSRNIIGYNSNSTNRQGNAFMMSSGGNLVSSEIQNLSNTIRQENGTLFKSTTGAGTTDWLGQTNNDEFLAICDIPGANASAMIKRYYADTGNSYLSCVKIPGSGNLIYQGSTIVSGRNANVEPLPVGGVNATANFIFTSTKFASYLSNTVTQVGIIKTGSSNIVNISGLGAYTSNGANLIPGRVTADSSDNATVAIQDVTNNKGYIFKVNSNVNLLWNKEVSNTQLTCCSSEGSNIFAAGFKTTGEMWIGKFDGNGEVLWQNKWSSNVGNTVPKTITNLNNNIIVAGNISNYGFVLKLTNNGQIPGNGNYTIGGNSYSYVKDSETVSNGTLLFAPLTPVNGIDTSSFSNASTNANVTITINSGTI